MGIHHRGNEWLKLEGILVARSSLRIGAATDIYLTSPAQLQVIRINRGNREVPYVPGSSLKGVLRSLCEGIVRSTELKPTACYPYKESCGDKKKRELEAAIRENDFQKILAIIEGFCITCKMFGTLGFAGNLTFFDAYPHDKVRIEVREGVAISRVGGGVAHGPFSIEYISENSEFCFKVLARNLPNHCIGLLCTALNEVNNGRAFIGGMKSRGFGKCEILLNKKESSDGKIEKTESKDKQNMRAFTKDILEKYEKSWSKYVESQK